MIKANLYKKTYDSSVCPWKIHTLSFWLFTHRKYELVLKKIFTKKKSWASFYMTKKTSDLVS